LFRSNVSSGIVRSAPETRPSLQRHETGDRSKGRSVNGAPASGEGRKALPDPPPGFVRVQAGELPHRPSEGAHDLVGDEEPRAPVALDLAALKEGLHRTGILLLERLAEDGEKIPPVLPAPREPVLEPSHPVPEVLFLGA